MPELSRTEIAALAYGGATNREIGAALGRAMSADERAVADRARLKRKAERVQKRKPGAQGYDDYKEVQRKRAAAKSQSGRHCGEIPDRVNDPRRRRCAENFRAFCEEYFAATFCLAFSDDHLRVIEKIETSVLRGGLFAVAMPRGSGKSSLTETACLWAMLYGHRDFVCLIGSDEAHAANMLDSIKTELEGNEEIAGDFPEIIVPIRALDGIVNRCSGQLYKWIDGESRRTQMSWTEDELVLPTMPDKQGVMEPAAGSGAIVRVAGITGRIRGMKFKRPDGRSARPSLVVIDDPQTDESARSLSQCATRERTLAGAVLGLAGPGKKIAGIMPCTVIRPGDMADRILDREKHPEWNGERTKMVYEFPTDVALWDRYNDLRMESLRQHGDIRDATSFYGANREAMDAGSRVAWDARHNHDELSAIQHAMNLRYQDEGAFFAEYQNEPMQETASASSPISADEVASRVNGMERGQVPIAAQHVTAFIDVQGNLLFWTVVAWDEDFTGWVLDYGAFPDQKSRYYTLRQANPTLASTYTEAGPEGAIYRGIERLAADLITRDWRRDDGTDMRIERCLVDAGWGQSTDTVYQACRASSHASALMPSHGRYVGASSKPFSEYDKRPGERVGLNWRVPVDKGRRQVRHAIIDTNFWKSCMLARLNTSIGDKGALTLFGRDPEAHRMFADHLTSEHPIQTAAKGRTVDEWKVNGPGVDNHWWDCLVGCAVGASMLGARVPGVDDLGGVRNEKRGPATGRVRVKFSEMQRQRRAARGQR